MTRLLLALLLTVSAAPTIAACPKQTALKGKAYSSYVEIYAGGQQLTDICLIRGAFNADGTVFAGNGYCTNTPDGEPAFAIRTELAKAAYDQRECIVRVTGTSTMPGSDPLAFSGTTTFSQNGKTFDTVRFEGETGFHYVERGTLQ